MQPYLKEFHDWLPSVNRAFFARDLTNIHKKITLGLLTVIIEFPSKEGAVAAYDRRNIKDDSINNSLFRPHKYYLSGCFTINIVLI